MKESLHPLPPDERDFLLGGYDPLPTLEELPEEFRLPFTVKDQTTTDWCSAFATCSASEVQEGVELNPGYSFAAGKIGNEEAWGNDLRSACSAHKDHGALPEAEMTVELRKLSLKERRYFDNWKKYEPVALKHKKKSYFKITGPYSDFDNIRAALYKYKTPVVIGIQFGYPLQQSHLIEPEEGMGHAMVAIGFTKDALIVGNSYGKKAGDKGVHYVHQQVINKWVPQYGAFTFIDEEPETVKYNQQYGIVKSDSWLVQMWKIFTLLFK